MSSYHGVNRWIILQHYSELYFGGGGCGEHPSGNNVKLFTGFYSMQTCGYEGYTDAGEDPGSYCCILRSDALKPFLNYSAAADAKYPSC